MKVLGQLEVAQLEQIAAATASPAARGRVYADITNSTSAVPLFYDGTLWRPMMETPSPSQNSNYSVVVSTSSNAMTIALKDKNGSDCTTSSAARFGFRSSTLTSGTFNERSVTSALSTVISSGSTGGTKSAQTYFMWVYLIDNSGTLELAWSLTLYNEQTRFTTTAEGGAGAADTNNIVYSTIARTNVPNRLIARLTVSETTAGTWVNGPSQIATGNFGALSASDDIILDANGSATTPGSGLTDVVWTTTTTDTHGAFGGTTWTCPKADYYDISFNLRIDNVSVSAGNSAQANIISSGTDLIKCLQLFGSTSDTIKTYGGSRKIFLTSGQLLKVQCASSGTTPSLSTTYCNFSISRAGR